jgi:hypothetical protein
MFLGRTISRFPTDQWYRDSPAASGFTLTSKDGSTDTSTNVLIENDGNSLTFDLVLVGKDGTTYTAG